jgi:hypothetical protein
MLALNGSMLNEEEFIECFQGLGFDHFNVQSPLNPFIENYTEKLHLITQRDVMSNKGKTSLNRSRSMEEVNCFSLIFTGTGTWPSRFGEPHMRK